MTDRTDPTRRIALVVEFDTDRGQWKCSITQPNPNAHTTYYWLTNPDAPSGSGRWMTPHGAPLESWVARTADLLHAHA